MKTNIAELDPVEVDKDQPYGLLEGAQGTAVAVHTDSCTVEFLDPYGYTVGLFEVPTVDLRLIEQLGSGVSVAREE